MVDILHRIAVKAAPFSVYNALASCDGLRGWWTSDTRGESHAGGVIHFRFGERGFIDMKVIELQPDARVLWRVVDGPREWVGTAVTWELRQEGEHTIILFKHAGWKEPVEFMHHCSTKWATFLMSLKALIETGQGAPWPNDVRVGDRGD